MDEPHKPTPRYRVGDLVSCAYDLYQFYRSSIPYYDDDEYGYDVVGIIVEVEYAMYSEIFGYEILYVVLCLDGLHRYFSEDELSKLG